MRRLKLLPLCLLLWAFPAHSTSDPLVGVLSEPGGSGMGIAARVQRSPYRDAGVRNDFMPLYLYDGKFAYLHAYRAGLKLERSETHRFDLFLAHRFESFPYGNIPASLAGMAERSAGIDLGVSYEYRAGWGAVFAELMQDVGNASHGAEARLGYQYDWKSGRLHVRPYATLGWRNAKLNNYYYGVLPGEATAARPAYEPGSGVNSQLGLFSSYGITEGWRLLAGVSATRWSRGVRESPIVDPRTEVAALLGLMYDFSPQHEAWPEKKPLVVKLLYGKSSDCSLQHIMTLQCTSTSTADGTRIAAVELGRPFIERLNDWPLDIVGYVGLQHHDERGLQKDLLELKVYMKAYWYGFPWNERVPTRLGFGAGLSYAQHVPFVEARDQAQRGRNTSKLLNYLDPSVDISIGGLLGVKSLRDAYLGVGVSHRSGIFGTSQMLGNVDGGSNYIYSYIEWGL